MRKRKLRVYMYCTVHVHTVCVLDNKNGVAEQHIQRNPSLAATVREWHFGCYMEVAFVEGFQVLRFLVHEKVINCCLYEGTCMCTL